MISDKKIEYPVSSGGVVYRHSKGSLEIVLCGRTKSKLWSLPKGTPVIGENLEETAIREVSEETGLEVVIQDKIGVINYSFVNEEKNIQYHKHVHFYLMVKSGGSFEKHDHEFDSVRWFSLEEALRVVTYENEIEVILKAKELIGSESNAKPGQ